MSAKDGTMHSMAKKQGADAPKPDRHKKKPFQLRLHPLLRQQLEKLAEANASDMTAEIVIAIRKHLTDSKLWPPQP